ncbi:2OG-Fe(II) oxygenase [Lignipirellula cremea]|uniref:Prolyl 4-hydroxylase alpha subunit Fe(2+) 2OG dioxygenase domain-containing protein n=1 Tax=Lignipirellula cremea TaxID=2528010 RepID=A0A518DPK7_9BACT|nr:2OG-Fe(II) oxygenase [Lignipirellula cremea]QDU93759.1 hypothetical protein Pla8534_15420 [Lignipirellula cremea]
MTNDVSPAVSPWRNALLQVLGGRPRPLLFCTSGEEPLIDPGLEVAEVGCVPLPLSEEQAQELIAVCRRSLNGQANRPAQDSPSGERRVWRLEPEQFSFTSPDWEDMLSGMVADLQEGLGLHDSELRVFPRQLVLYEPGGFLAPPHAGGKIEGMLVDLVIGLPSPFTGGRLVVEHERERRELPFTLASRGDGISFAAYFNDCRHAVERVLSGYRLAMHYSVVAAKAWKRKGEEKEVVDDSIGSVAQLLHAWREASLDHKLAVTLEHTYSLQGLRFDRLQGADRSRSATLLAAAEQCGFHAHVAMVTHYVTGPARTPARPLGPPREGASSPGGKENPKSPVSDLSLIEVVEERLTVDSWSDRQGQTVELGSIAIKESEIVSGLPIEAWQGVREEVESDPAGETVHVERWYRCAAIVLWPQEKHFDVLCEAGIDAAIGGLSMLCRQTRIPASRRDEHQQQCLSFAAAILDQWSEIQGAVRTARQGSHRAEFPAMLVQINDPDLVRRYLSEVVAKSENASFGTSLLPCFKQHGWTNFADALKQVFEATRPANLTERVAALHMLCEQADEDPDRLGICRDLLETFITELKKLDNEKQADGWAGPAVDRAELTATLISALIDCSAAQSLSNLIDHLQTAPEIYPASVQVEALFQLESLIRKKRLATGALINAWVATVRQQLLRQTAVPPALTTDWSQPGDLSCTCEDCTALSRFLVDSSQREYRVALRKDRREHLETVIDQSQPQLECSTDRQTNPHTLVGTKISDAYDQAVHIRRQELKSLQQLVELQMKLPKVR